MAGRPKRRARLLAESRRDSSRRRRRKDRRGGRSMTRDLRELYALERGDCPTRGYVVAHHIRRDVRVPSASLRAHQRLLPALLRHAKSVTSRFSKSRRLQTFCFNGRMFTAVKVK